MSNSGRNTTLESEAMRTTFSERVTKTFYFTKLKELIPVDFLFVNDVFFFHCVAVSEKPEVDDVIHCGLCRGNKS